MCNFRESNLAYSDQSSLAITLSTEETEVIEIPFMSAIEKVDKRTRILINPGISVWALDWVPSNEGDMQYLAISGYMNKKERHREGERQEEDVEGVIQIWGLNQKNFETKLVMALNHTFGCVFDMKWCPNAVMDVKKVRDVL